MNINVIRHHHMLAATALALALGSCSTEVVDMPPFENSSPGEEIVLNLSGDELPVTRADASHKLRFVAKLYKGDILDKNLTDVMEYQETKHAIAENGKQTITFSKPEGVYSIFLFADYIPSDTKTITDASGNELYDDCYYVTNSSNSKMEVGMVTGGTRPVINNDHYDCFAGVIRVEKDENVFERTLALERAVARVSFVSSTSTPADVDNIHIGKISLYNTLAWTSIDKSKTEFYPMKDAAGSPEQNICTGITANVSATEANELFFFYTFANDNAQKENHVLWDMNFTINFKDQGDVKVQSRKIDISSGLVRVKRNHKTKVKGAFYQSDKSKLGDIILNLSNSDEWESEVISITNPNQ